MLAFVGGSLLCLSVLVTAPSFAAADDSNLHTKERKMYEQYDPDKHPIIVLTRTTSLSCVYSKKYARVYVYVSDNMMIWD